MTKATKIYVVEDDPLISLDIQEALQHFGYEVVGHSTTAEEALEKLFTAGPDLVLMDITLKGKMDGIEAASEIGRRSHLPIIFLTALNDEETLRRARMTKPFGYLIKPFDPAELHATIELTIDRVGQSTLSADGVSGAPHDWEGEAEPTPLDSDQILPVLRQTHFLNELPPKILEELASMFRVRSADAGEYLAIEGDDSAGGFIVHSGRVSMIRSTIPGKELTVSLLGPGDVAGILYAIPGLSDGCSAKCQIPSKVLWITRASLLSFCSQHPELQSRLIAILSSELVSMYTLAGSLAHGRVEDRIVHTLLALLGRFGKQGTAGRNESRLYLTRKELAELTGTTPETAIRVTKNLEREGLLDLTRPGIIKMKDVPALELMTRTD